MATREAIHTYKYTNVHYYVERVGRRISDPLHGEKRTNKKFNLEESKLRWLENDKYDEP